MEYQQNLYHHVINVYFSSDLAAFTEIIKGLDIATGTKTIGRLFIALTLKSGNGKYQLNIYFRYSSNPELEKLVINCYDNNSFRVETGF